MNPTGNRRTCSRRPSGRRSVIFPEISVPRGRTPLPRMPESDRSSTRAPRRRYSNGRGQAGHRDALHKKHGLCSSPPSPFRRRPRPHHEDRGGARDLDIPRDTALGLARRPPEGVPADGAVAPHRRQGDPAQEPEPDLLPDQRRRARGHPRRRGDGAPSRARLGLPVLPRPRLLPGPRRHAARDAAAGRGRQGRPVVGRPPDAVALGPHPLEHRLRVEPDRLPVPSGHRLRRGHAPAHRVARPARRRAPRARRRDVRLGGRRHDERGRVLGIAQHGQQRSAPDRLPHRGQRLRDLGAGRSADAGRRHLAPRRGVSPPEGLPRGRHRPARRASRRWRRPSPTRAAARARPSCTRR